MFKINEKLRQDILSGIPQGYSKLKQAIYIYNQLCLTTEYSMPYYIDEKNVREWYQNIDNLQLIDGETRKDVVCFTFNAIYMQLLIDAGLIDEEEHKNVIRYKNNTLSAVHEELELNIDGQKYWVDATKGVLSNNDLVYAKYDDMASLQGWEVYYDDVRPTNEQYKALEDAIKEVRKDNIDKSVQKMNYLKLKDQEYHKLPLEDRLKLFDELVLETKGYNMGTFNYFLRLKRLLLFNECRAAQLPEGQKTDVVFAKDAKSGLYKMYVFVNPKGYIDDEGYENFETLQIFQYDITDNGVTKQPIEKDEFMEQISTGKVVTRTDSAINSKTEADMLLVKPGKKNLSIQYKNNDQSQGISGYVRTIIATGQKIYYNANMERIDEN